MVRVRVRVRVRVSVSDRIRDLLRREGIEAKLCRPADRVGEGWGQG